MVVAHLENRKESGKNISDEKIRVKVGQIHQKLSKSGKNEIVLANVLENVDIVHFIFIFFQKIKVISVDKFESGWEGTF